jgi:uncharacterized protein (UPF0371 family)
MTLYDIIADLRREHGNETASKSLDLVMIELGHTRDNRFPPAAGADRRG